MSKKRNSNAHNGTDSSEIKLFKMCLDKKRADVHPDEVENMERHGWKIIKD